MIYDKLVQGTALALVYFARDQITFATMRANDPFTYARLRYDGDKIQRNFYTRDFFLSFLFFFSLLATNAIFFFFLPALEFEPPR